MKSPVRAAVLPCLLLTSAWAAEKPAAPNENPPNGLPKFSPFDVRGGAAAPVNTANEVIEFAGVSAVGKRTDLIFFDKTAKKSHWIAKGETKEGISVVNYDERREEAIIKVNGVQKTLPLRKGASPSQGLKGVPSTPVGFNQPPPMPVAVAAPPMAPVYGAVPLPVPVEPAATAPKPITPATPETQVKQETEARMLVSDLLEIGMAQRKAYEDAQRRTAEGGPAAATPATPAPPPGTPTPPPGSTNPPPAQPAP